jgi:hypothetical protein
LSVNIHEFSKIDSVTFCTKIGREERREMEEAKRE